VLIFLALGMGILVIAVLHTVTAVNQVSTPAPSLSGAALGGNPTITVDTGPARTAVSAGQPSPTRSPEPTATTATTPTPDGEGNGPLPSPPSREVTSTQEATTQALAGGTPVQVKDTPTPTVRLSEIERIVNGGLEADLEGWYTEGAVTTVTDEPVSGSRALVFPADGGFVDQWIKFLPGITYRLTGWGKVMERGDTLQLGIHYRNDAGERLRDLEPEPLRFNSRTFSQKSLDFTVPGGVASVSVYLWKPSGAGEAVADDISLRSLIPNTSEPGVTPASNAVTILLMGVDARPGEAIDIGVRPDSLMVLRLNPETGSCRMLSIPRDTRTELPGYGLTKVNHALAVGGIPYQEQVVELLLGIPIDHYVLVDFAGFETLVDAVGGITIDVPEGFVATDGTVFVAGQQAMTGKQALAYARYRGGPDGDFGRIQRQQEVLRALIRRASGLNLVRSINELLPAVRQHVRTDLSAAEIASFALTYRDTCTAERLDVFRLEGYGATFDDPLLNLPLWYLVVDEAEIHRKVQMLLEP
jgi:LCP family protein required for cell wall assembly